MEVQRQLDTDLITNLVSLGDSNMEMEAVHVMGNKFDTALVLDAILGDRTSREDMIAG